MRIAVLSDIRGLAALLAVAANLRTQGVDAVVNLGDGVWPLLHLETAQYLMAQDWNTHRQP